MSMVLLVARRHFYLTEQQPMVIFASAMNLIAGPLMWLAVQCLRREDRVRRGDVDSGSVSECYRGDSE